MFNSLNNGKTKRNKTKKKALTSPTMSSNSRSLSSSPPAEKEQKTLYRDCLFHAPRGDSERRVLYGCNPPDRLERTTIRHEERLKLQKGVLLHVSKAMTNKHIFAFTGVDIPYFRTKKTKRMKVPKETQCICLSRLMGESAFLVPDSLSSRRISSSNGYVIYKQIKTKPCKSRFYRFHQPSYSIC